eukprot:IDg8624t1
MRKEDAPLPSNSDICTFGQLKCDLCGGKAPFPTPPHLQHIRALLAYTHRYDPAAVQSRFAAMTNTAREIALSH